MSLLKNMVSSGDEISSKRVISLIGLIIYIGVVVCTISGLNVPDIIFYTLISIILGSQGLTVIPKNNNNNKN